MVLLRLKQVQGETHDVRRENEQLKLSLERQRSTYRHLLEEYTSQTDSSRRSLLSKLQHNRNDLIQEKRLLENQKVSCEEEICFLKTEIRSMLFKIQLFRQDHRKLADHVQQVVSNTQVKIAQEGKEQTSRAEDWRRVKLEYDRISVGLKDQSVIYDQHKLRMNNLEKTLSGVVQWKGILLNQLETTLTDDKSLEAQISELQTELAQRHAAISSASEETKQAAAKIDELRAAIQQKKSEQEAQATREKQEFEKQISDLELQIKMKYAEDLAILQRKYNEEWNQLNEALRGQADELNKSKEGYWVQIRAGRRELEKAQAWDKFISTLGFQLPFDSGPS